MRSFIKSYKKANSLDESPSRIAVSPPKTGRRSDNSTSQKILEDSLAFVPSTPTQISHNSNGSKHSPSFESLHRLANKKMFSTKLFKKNSSSTALAQVAASSGSNHDIPNITEAPSRNSGSTLEATQLNGDEATIPSIKGTITHNWGDNTDKQHPVIILNNPSGGDNVFSQDLEPAVRITSLRRGSAISSLTTASYENALPRTSSADEQLLRRSEPTRDKHVYNELWKVKSKNRQARIHSHDDIITLEKSSTVSLNLLESTISPLAPLQNLEQPDNTSDRPGSSSDTQKQLALNGRATNEAHPSDASKKDHLGVSVSFEDATDLETEKHDGSETEEDDGSMLRTPEIDEEDDDTSKFSFEMSGLNGRTSSVKYYSKPEPKEAVYIDDVYDDEDFDEDMNFYGDDLQNNDFHLTDETFIAVSSPADGPGDSDPNSAKPLKRYNDLFDLSDDAEDSEYQLNTEDESQEYEAATSPTELPVSNPDDQGSLNNKYGGGCSKIKNAADSGSKKRPPEKKMTTKAIKSFSDIFDLVDSDEDDESEVDSGWNGEFRNNDEPDNTIYDKEQLAHAFSIENDSQSNGLKDATKDISNHTGKDISSAQSLPVRSGTPVHIFVTPPMDPSMDSAASADSHLSPGLNITPSLPRPARSQTLKIHDLNSSLDSEVPGLMSNLYFIDEAEEDKYNQRNGITEDDYLDEINTVPEDFDFSDTEQDLNSNKSPLKLSNRGSFRSTHSYSEQPIGAARESTPTRNKLEIKNKTVTFFNYCGERSPIERSAQKSPQAGQGYLTSPNNNNEDYVISPIKKNGEACNPVTPTNSFKKPKPEYLNDYSLSPIQENSSSVDNSPSLQLQ
ncbi:hypothetical protein HG536_0D05530 [Torulaspora globosa]|uniref:Zinc-regulated protein 8 n=1 Tax=Torulaspora globosa TaxID=48254 RepID=A0A7G3ZHP6_9SACH|nr:uncharacterized protein HG536_0D05530 [Torulaspora globosa]QLL33032.1 hypothetical protein HG536_0D05530 [Torulaspora globosa]